MQAILRTLRHFFTPQTCLPTAEETGLSAQTTEEANKAVEDVLKPQRLASASENRKKRKYTTSFAPEDWGHIHVGRYAAENGNGA